ncbi:MAG: TlpA family protein disulfide reductase, partial [Chlorobi bacterium]|nr:TlpA family protein disulfide reductase [Chlorobiota bacterium]
SPVPLSDSRIAPDFSLVRADGGTMGIGDLRGKVVILDFWATWCAPCKREIPDFIDLQKTYGDQGLVVMGVALDKRDAVDAFIEQQGINYPILYGNENVSQLYGGITGIPTTFIIDRDGFIQEKFVGYRPRKTFEEAIKKLL